MFCFSHGNNIPGTVISGNHDAGANTQAHKNIHQQIDQGPGRGNSRQRRMAVCIVPDNDDICSVIKQLQDSCQNQRAGKSKDLRKERPFRHIHLMPAVSVSESEHLLLLRINSLFSSG